MTRLRRVRPVRFVLAVLAATVTASPARAAGQDDVQPPPPYETAVDIERDWSDQIPAHVYAVDGTVELERDAVARPADENEPLLAGDRLRTARGRVEVLFADGSTLALDDYTEVDLLSDALLRLNAGRIRLSIARGASALDYRVDAGGATASLQSAGDYRITLDTRSTDPDVRLTVLRGTAELSSPFGRTLVRTGLEAHTTARTQPSLPYGVNVSLYDEFDRWVEDQYRYRTGSRSAQYLPAELRHYSGALDHHGAWQYETGYGYVWYPTVAADWRPYYHGGWSFVGSFGWMWIGGSRWSWPTHHYGRWGFRANRWFWIPGRRWAPAWVVWGSAPGYVSWCPLGFDNRPVFAITSIAVYRGAPRHGWTVLPTHAFRSRVAVSRYAVRTLPSGVGSRFAVHRSAPYRPAGITTRAVEPLRSPTHASTRFAVPRSRAGAVSAATASSSPSANVRTARGRASAGGGRVAATPAPARGPSNVSTRAPAERPQPSRMRVGPRSAPSASAPPAGDRAPARRAAPRGSRTAPPAPAAPVERAAPGGSSNRGSDAPPARRATPRSSRSAPSAPVERATPGRSESRGSQAPAARRATGRQSRAVSPAPAPARREIRADRPAPRATWGPSPSANRAPSRRAEGRARVAPNPPSAPRPVVRSPGRVERSAPSPAPRVQRPAPAQRVQRAAPSRSSAPSASRGRARGRSR